MATVFFFYKMDRTWDDKVGSVSAISHPLVSEKLNKKLLKVVKKASKQKHVKRGVKEVVKGLRKGAQGLVVIAGDISPIDVVSHLAVLCEDQNIPYVYVPSKDDLGSAGATKRPTSCVMLVAQKDCDYQDDYAQVFDTIKELNSTLITKDSQ